MLGGPDAWKNADQTEGAAEPPCIPCPLGRTPRVHSRAAATCSKCGHDRAYYQQLQIRSADEPMTTFYKCTSCGTRWRED